MKNLNGYIPKKNDLKVLVTLKDGGQDLLLLLIAFYPDYGFGAVMDTDMQSDIWTKYFVLSGKPAEGEYLTISESPTSEVITMKYEIERVQFVGRSTNWELSVAASA